LAQRFGFELQLPLEVEKRLAEINRSQLNLFAEGRDAPSGRPSNVEI
jgi:hypothetical protein